MGILLWAIPGFTAFIGLEVLGMMLREKHGDELRGYETTDAWASIGMGVGHLISAGLLKGASLLVLFAAYEYRVFDLPIDTAWYWVLVIFAEDFEYYWFHRFGHRTRVGWAAHVAHHSSTYFNYSTALRQSWTTPLLHVWFMVPLALLGFHPLSIFLVHAFSLLYQFWVHTEVIRDLPRWFGWVMNTPSFHRVHHGANDEYVDRNYAGTFIIWDRIFGTFQPEGAKVYYGLRKEFESRNLLVIAFHEWVAMFRHIWRAKRWKNKLLYIVMPPAWDPDDERAEHFQGDFTVPPSARESSQDEQVDIEAKAGTDALEPVALASVD